MKKRICLILLCGIVLLGVCGCGNKEIEEIYGTYYNYNFDDFTGELTLYKNGSCEFSYKKILFGKEKVNTSSKEYCSYDYTDEKLSISYNSYVLPETYLKINCSIDGKKLDCDAEGIFEKK